MDLDVYDGVSEALFDVLEAETPLTPFWLVDDEDIVLVIS